MCKSMCVCTCLEEKNWRYLEHIHSESDVTQSMRERMPNKKPWLCCYHKQVTEESWHLLITEFQRNSQSPMTQSLGGQLSHPQRQRPNAAKMEKRKDGKDRKADQTVLKLPWWLLSIVSLRLTDLGLPKCTLLW